MKNECIGNKSRFNKGSNSTGRLEPGSRSAF